MQRIFSRSVTTGVAALLGMIYAAVGTADSTTTVTLADQPVFAGGNVPGNLALALSVEFPTANSVANIGDYADAQGNDTKEYLGYFDPRKCYDYVYVPGTQPTGYFQPKSLSTDTNHHRCSGLWSGNFMNWATMQTIDPFRWALSGGYRSVDTTSLTITEKAWQSGQGGTGNFPNRGTLQGSSQTNGNKLLSTYVPLVTPFASTDFNLNIAGRGNTMAFTLSSIPATAAALLTTPSPTDYTQPSDVYGNGLLGYLLGQILPSAFDVYVRVKVCDPTAGLEANCVKYGNNYKPEGLLQQYSNKVRFSAFSYLNGDGATRQGGVIREPMGFIGPTYPQPTSSSVVANTRAEWDGTTGIMNNNPDPLLSGTTTVAGTQSGVMNYLNKFGETAQKYMSDDNVSELYYAVVRYYENLGNVPQWTNTPSTAELDGFPEAITWDDPILYACQKNFILGIGDDHTHVDYNVGGATDYSGSRPKPTAVSNDNFNQATIWTRNLQALEGITQNPFWAAGAGQATYYIAGLAYGVHVNDIRPDTTNPTLLGNQTVSTYWMDVAENQRVEYLNPYYLASKYGGFSVTLPTPPATYNMTTALAQGQWWTSGLPNIVMNGGAGSAVPPDNYFVASNAGLMVSGLKAAFQNIGNTVNAFTTAYSLSQASVSTGNSSFSASYDSSNWTGIITGSTLNFDSSGNALAPTATWATSTALETQLAGTGSQTARRVATWNGSTGVAFQTANLSSAQLTALTPSYSTATTPPRYLNYLRGDRTDEVGSTVAGSSKSLRARTLLLGDIVDATLTAVSVPSQTYSESVNPNYGKFKSDNAARQPMVYAAANDGMVHGFVGSSLVEQFAYVPSAVITGPNNTPQVDGLAQLGNPTYSHHFYVDATPLTFDIDLNRTGGTTSPSSSNWATLLIGGLGKGGKSYYAIDVTDPVKQMTTEAAAATKVKWEFTDSTMGYSFGAPVVVKTVKYGWVVAFTSGYNNSDGYGYLYLVNPNTGALLQKIATPSASSGMTQAAAYVQDYSDYTSDSIYVGDLNGQVWRFDLTGTPAVYPQPTLIAVVKDAAGNAQPITTAPLIEIHPTTRKRYVMFGTGRLLSFLDVASTAAQSFYTLIDGTAGGFSTITTAYQPRSDSRFLPVTNVAAGITLTPTMKGWYYDLGADSKTGIARRIILNPKAYNGIVSFADLLTTGDACSPKGTSYVYAVNYSNGVSVLGANTSVSTSTAGVTYNATGGYYAIGSAVTDLRFASVNGKTELIAGDAMGDIVQVYASLGSVLSTRLLNWREIPTAD